MCLILLEQSNANADYSPSPRLFPEKIHPLQQFQHQPLLTRMSLLRYDLQELSLHQNPPPFHHDPTNRRQQPTQFRQPLDRILLPLHHQPPRQVTGRNVSLSR